MSVGVKVGTAGAGADGGGLRYHFQDGAEVELARPEPPAQGVGGILGSRLEAVHGRLEVRRSSIYLGFELLLLLLAVMVVVMMGIIYNVKLCENMRPEEEREREQCDDNNTYMAHNVPLTKTYKYVPLLPREVAGISPIPYRHGTTPPPDHAVLRWFRHMYWCATGSMCRRCLG